MADKLPPEHIGNIPAGHKRDEENRKRTDSLAQELEKDNEAGGLSTDALKPEREILQKLDPFTGDFPVSNPQPGRHYVGVKAHNVVTAAYKAMGYRPVQGSDPEAEEFKGQDAAGASSLRSIGDVLLFWCPIELHEAREKRDLERARSMIGDVEMNWAEDANYGPNSPTRRFGPLAHGDPNDQLLRRTVFRGTAGQIERVSDALKAGRMVPGVQVKDQ